MSRIGKHPVAIPSGVDVKIDGKQVTTKGKLGQLSMTISDLVDAMIDDGKIVVKPATEDQKSRSLYATTRTLLNNMVVGVSAGFTRNLEITGVGYRAQLKGQTLVLQLGYSHDIEYPVPEGVKITCEKPTSISIFGADRKQIGQIAAEIRAFRPPEPYKGKGVRYADEFILRKEGKKK